MIRFACPGCDATFTVADDRAGKTGKCPRCQSQFIIPDANTPPPPPDQSPPPSQEEQPPPLPDQQDLPLPEPGVGVAISSVSPPPQLPPAPEPPTEYRSVEVAPCPECGSRLSVMLEDLGYDVECPTCGTAFKAIRPEEAAQKARERNERRHRGSDRPSRRGDFRFREEDGDEREQGSRRSRRQRYRDDDDEYEDDEIYEEYDRKMGRADIGKVKPGGYTAVAVLFLVGGILGLISVLGIGGFYAFSSSGLCCLWPGWWYEIIWSIAAMMKGTEMLGKDRPRHPPTAIAVTQIICIINGDIINLIMGIINLVLLNDPLVSNYFARRKL